MKFAYRQTLLAVLLLGIVCTGGSFFAQYVMGLNPCPLCILQRVAVMSVMLVSGLCLLLPTAKRGGRIFAALLVSLPALWGLYTKSGCKACPPESSRVAAHRGRSV